jgi:hypothetical protein
MLTRQFFMLIPRHVGPTVNISPMRESVVAATTGVSTTSISAEIWPASTRAKMPFGSPPIGPRNGSRRTEVRGSDRPAIVSRVNSDDGDCSNDRMIEAIVTTKVDAYDGLVGRVFERAQSDAQPLLSTQARAQRAECCNASSSFGK